MGLRKRKGDVLITIIIAMLIMGVLGAGIYSVTTSSTFGELLSNRSDNAYDLARAGVRYGVAIQLANYPETTFYMPDANSTFKIKIENYMITSTGIANAGSFLESRRVIVYDLAVTWGSGTGTSEPPPPTSPVIESNTEFPSFSDPIASGESGGSAVEADPDTSTVTLGGGVEDSYGSLWYQGSSIVGYCADGICNFGLGIRAYFEYTFLNEDYSSDSTTFADGFTFAVLSAINNTRDRTGGAVGQGELIGYAGAGSTADGLGLKPPKLALEFDTFPNPGTGNICSSGSRNDPRTTSGPPWNPTYTFYNHAALMFWGAGTASGSSCTGSANSYDDNRHGAGGSGGDPQNTAGTGDTGYYQGAKETCASSSNTCNWMESGHPYVCRVEIVRPGSATGGLYNYEIKAWISRKDSFTDSLALSRFQDIIVPYSDTAWQVTKTVSLSEAHHNDFSKIFFGFTEATGSSTQQIELSNFRVFFPQGDCAYSISPASAEAAAAGGSDSISLTTTTACPWMTSSLDSWIAITSGGVGAGNGTIAYNVAANTGPARTGRINIVGQTFTVHQADGCVYALSSYSRSFSSSADNSNTVSVTAAGNCPWTAVSNDAWITVNSGAGGTGNGTVNYGVAANTGPARTGTMTIAGLTFTVTQDSGCSYSLSSTSRNFDEDADSSNTVSVTAGSTCPWTAVSNAAWITINSGASGTGNGTVNYGIAANTGPERTGTMTIAGRTFTVTQDGGCTFTLSPGSATFGCSGGTGSFTVTTSNSACAWTASENRTWTGITSGSSGSGSGTIHYTVSTWTCSGSGATRSATMTLRDASTGSTEDTSSITQNHH